LALQILLVGRDASAAPLARAGPGCNRKYRACNAACVKAQFVTDTNGASAAACCVINSPALP
jgi:hypothetical protein